MKSIIKLIAIVFACGLLLSCGSGQPMLEKLHQGDVIVAFGDSLTYGIGAKQEESYPAVLQSIIGFEVINAGVPGEETAGGLSRIQAVLEEYAPRLVILCLGGNDQIRKRSPQVTKANLDKIINIIKQSGAQLVIVAVPKPSVTLSVPGIYQELADQYELPIADTLLAELMAQQKLKADYVHLNAKGYAEMAKHIAELLRAEGAVK